MGGIDLAGHLHLIIVWSTFQIFATVSLTALVAATLIIQRSKANASLILLEISLVLTAGTSSILIWTGNALNQRPSSSLCLFNAAATLSATPFIASATFMLTITVWGGVMAACRPSWRKAISWITWTPLLLIFPAIVALTMFFVSLGLGLNHLDDVFRGSYFYCVINYERLRFVSVFIAVTFTFLSLLLGVWTAIMFLWIRRRLSRFNVNPLVSSGMNQYFALRVFIFLAYVCMAFIIGVIALFTSLSLVLTNIVISLAGVFAFFVFASSANIICPVLGICRRSPSAAYTTSPITHRPPYGVRITQTRHMRSYRIEPVASNYSEPSYSKRPSRSVSTDDCNTEACNATGSKAKMPVVSIVTSVDQEAGLIDSDCCSVTRCRRHSAPLVDPIAWFRTYGRRVTEPYEKTYLP